MHVLTHHHAGINLGLRIDEELSTVLKVVNGVGHRSAGVHRNQRAVRTAADLTLVWLVVLESMRHNGLSLAGCQHVGTQTNDTS